MDTKDVERNLGSCTEEDRTLFQSIVGSLMYLANATHLDISYAVTRLAQFASNIGEKHLVAIKRGLRYIKGTLDAKLQIATTATDSVSLLIGYFDSSWLDNPTDRCSTYGIVILQNSLLILWKSKKHSMVTMSTCESEYLAGTELIRDLCWIRNILIGLNFPPALPVTVFGDNENANGIASNGVQHRTQHIEARHFCITEKVREGLIMVQYLPTEHMIPDMFTKTLPQDTIKRHSRSLGLSFRLPRTLAPFAICLSSQTIPYTNICVRNMVIIRELTSKKSTYTYTYT